MASFVDKSFDALNLRYTRISSFYSDLEAKLTDIGAPYTIHLDIYWDGSKVRIIASDEQISGLSNSVKLKYYTQGLGLMKLAINNQLYA